MKFPGNRAWLLVAFLLSLVFAGCTTPIPGARQDLLRFLETGRTTREEVMLKLGQPSASFEQEKILTYRIGQDDKQGFYIVTAKALQPWQAVRFSLVLVFNSDGVLQKQSLVRVQ